MIGKLATLVVMIAAIPGAAVAADQANMVLPEVTVTAPPPAPPSWRKFTPYFGNPRVEESTWPDVPCGNSRIAVVGASSCKSGPSLQHAAIGGVNGNLSVDLGSCRIAHDLVMTTLANLSVEADVTVIDPYYVSATGVPHKGCAVETSYEDLRTDFADFNQMTRKGSGWRNFAEYSDLTTMAFSVGGSDCLAFEKRGAVWRSGYVSVIRASLCHQDGRPVEVGDIYRVLASLRITSYEPQGNLRSAP